MGPRLKDLPKEIQIRALACQLEQGKSHDLLSHLDYAFNWSNTSEHHYFWSRICDGDYNEFYKRYPSKPMQSSQAITKRSLVEIHKQVSCLQFKQVVENYLTIAILKFDNDLINISNEDIKRLYSHGDTFQIDICEAYGIKKPKSELPKSWEELNTVSGYFVTGNAKISNLDKETVRTEDCNKNIWPSKEEAEASLALAQLRQIQKRWRNGWIPDHKDGTIKYSINNYGNQIAKAEYTAINSPICFSSEILRDKFFNEPKIRELLEIAKPLL